MNRLFDLSGYERFLGTLSSYVSRSSKPGAKHFCFSPRTTIIPAFVFKKLHRSYPYWSVRFGRGYRAVCRREGNTAEWLWIGTHQDFDKAF
jgi:hypothetical protein